MEEFKGVAAIEKELYYLHDIRGRCWRNDEDSWSDIGPGGIIAMCISLEINRTDLSDNALSSNEPCPRPECLDRGILLEGRRKDWLVWYVREKTPTNA